MILKTVCAFLSLVLEVFGVYGDGEFKWRYGLVLNDTSLVSSAGVICKLTPHTLSLSSFCGITQTISCRYPYITVVINFSQMWALYCLVQFYNVTHHRLAAIKPLAKFISFKAIVFATWWQGVGIAIICYCGILPKQGKIQNGIQDFLICIEVSVYCIKHCENIGLTKHLECFLLGIMRGKNSFLQFSFYSAVCE